MVQKLSSGIALCLLAAMLWGGMFPVMSVALRHIDPFTFTSVRYLIAGVIFVAIALILEGRSGIDLRGERVGLAWLCGTSGFAIFNFLIFYGQQIVGHDGALSASVMVATMPMLGMLVNWRLTGQTPRPYSLMFILMSFTGVLLVVTKGDVAAVISNPRSYLADGMMMFAALGWVIYTVGATFFPHWSSYKYTAVTTALGLSSVLPINFALYAAGAVSVPSLMDFSHIVPEMGYMALIAGVVGVLSWNLGNRIVTPVNGVLFMNVVPISAFVISAAQGIVPETAQIAGASITCTALILNNLYLRVLARPTARAGSA